MEIAPGEWVAMTWPEAWLRRCPAAKCQKMSDSSEELEAKKEAAILALLTSKNVEEAARSIEVDPRTLYRWMKEPAFNAGYRDAKRAAYSQAIARMHQMTTAAVSTLGKVMVDPSTPASTRVRAADSILNH